MDNEQVIFQRSELFVSTPPVSCFLFGTLGSYDPSFSTSARHQCCLFPLNESHLALCLLLCCQPRCHKSHLSLPSCSLRPCPAASDSTSASPANNCTHTQWPRSASSCLCNHPRTEHFSLPLLFLPPPLALHPQLLPPCVVRHSPQSSSHLCPSCSFHTPAFSACMTAILTASGTSRSWCFGSLESMQQSAFFDSSAFVQKPLLVTISSSTSISINSLFLSHLVHH
jgi:hypothetical protein